MLEHHKPGIIWVSTCPQSACIAALTANKGAAIDHSQMQSGRPPWASTFCLTSPRHRSAHEHTVQPRQTRKNRLERIDAQNLLIVNLSTFDPEIGADRWIAYCIAAQIPCEYAFLCLLGVADWQAAVCVDMLPDQPPFGVGDVRVQDLRPRVDTVRQAHRDIKVRRITAAHSVKGNAPSMAFHAGCRRPVKCAYPLAYPPAAPRPTDVDRIVRAAARNHIDTRTIR